MQRLRVSLGSVAIALLGACNFSSPGTISGASAVVSGSVMVPTKLAALVGGGSGPRGLRVLDAAGLSEQAGAGAEVTLLTRYGQALGTAQNVPADASGHFAWTAALADGLYLVDVHYGKAHLQTFVRVKGNVAASTLVDAASSLVTSRIARTKLKLTGLDQGEFDAIAAQAHGLMLDSDVPDLTRDDLVASGSETFLAGHLVIKQRIDALLSKLAAMEGVSSDPTATLPTASTPPSAPPATPTPNPTYTYEPTPAPGNVNLANTTTLEAIATQSLDSAPGWLANEGSNFLWVTCPASNSLMRMDRMFDAWPVSQARWKHYPISSTVASKFVPAQLAIDQPDSGAASVWVGNQRSDGTKVAHYDLLGNFLGAVDVGLAPSAVAIDTAGPARHVWIGVTGDTSGTIGVLNPAGNLVATGQVAPHPFLLAGYHYTSTTFSGDDMWVATPRTLYRIPVTNIVPPTLETGGSQVSTVQFSAQSNPLFNHDIAAMTLDNAGTVWLALQDSTHTQGVLCTLDPETLVLSQPIPFGITAPIVSVMLDPLNATWNHAYVATSREILHFNGANYASYPQSNPVLGLFMGTDYTFWGLYDGPPRILKLTSGP